MTMYFVYDLIWDGDKFKFREFHDSVGFESLKDAFEYASKGILCARKEDVYLFKDYTPRNVLEGRYYYIGLAKIDMKDKGAHEKALQNFNKIEIN